MVDRGSPGCCSFYYFSAKKKCQDMATYMILDGQTLATEVAGSALEGLLQDLGSVAQEAAQEMGPGASSDEVAAHAVKAGHA